MRLSAAQARDRFVRSRVARLATADADGRPHPVPVTFAVTESRLVIAVDNKPKTTRNLRRIRNITANPAVSVLVDEYDEDWSALWWARADGEASVLTEADRMAQPLSLLVAKYQQYQRSRPPGPVISIEVTRWSGWSGHTG
jgi:PPOX class probable F420-dependent enzyme